MTGTDLSLLAEEMRKAQDILEKIREMKSGVIGDTRIAVQASVDSTISTVSTFYEPFLSYIEPHYESEAVQSFYYENEFSIHMQTLLIFV